LHTVVGPSRQAFGQSGFEVSKGFCVMVGDAMSHVWIFVCSFYSLDANMFNAAIPVLY
jgi:hypothetical protein